MTRFLTAIVLSGMMSLPFSGTEAAAATCPVMPDHQGSAKHQVVYQGKTYELCCKSCVRKFKKNPEKYLKSACTGDSCQ